MEIEEKIKKIEDEIRTTPYHKGTEHHIGKLKAKLAKLKDLLLLPKKKSKGVGFAIKKEGDATLVLLGFPSVGKSTLLNKLTRAKSRVGDYKFTTLSVIPGILELNGAKIQVLDLPGLISGASKGRGWGRQILSVARVADLLLILVEADKIDQEKIIREELYKAGVRINEQPPMVLIKKKERGGIKVISSPLFHLKEKLIIEVAQEFGLKNGEIMIKEDLTLDELIDAFSQNRVYLPAIFVINKIDLVGNLSKLRNKYQDHIFICAKEGIGLSYLKQAIWEKLKLIRIYLKPKDGEPDFLNPLVLKNGATVLEVAQRLSLDLTKNLKGAKIFGQKKKYQVQVVGLNYKLADKTILTLLD